MNVKTKKVIQLGLHSIVLASGMSALNANAISVIAPLDSPVSVAVASADCNMVSTNSTFNFTPSRNVGLTWACNTTAVAVNAGNTKGKYVYGGSSNGGSVKQCGTTTASTSTGYSATPAVTADGCS